MGSKRVWRLSEYPFLAATGVECLKSYPDADVGGSTISAAISTYDVPLSGVEIPPLKNERAEELGMLVPVQWHGSEASYRTSAEKALHSKDGRSGASWVHEALRHLRTYARPIILADGGGGVSKRDARISCAHLLRTR